MKKLILGLFVLALLAGSAWAQTPTAGWNAFVIREGANEAPFINDASGTYGPGAIEIGTTEGGQKAGLATNFLNGATVDEIGSLHLDRQDDVLTSGSLYGPYFNIWITDGAGQYAVIGNEPSNGVWAADRWYVSDWDFLKTKIAKVYEVPGWNTLDSWVHIYAQGNGWDGVAANLTFEHLAGLVIEPPSAAYILDGANGVGSGAPDELGTNVAYGYNWIFGDTAANYVSGGDGFIVNNYYAIIADPVYNMTQDLYYDTIQAALDAAMVGDAITAAPGHYEEQLHVTVDNVSVTGAGVGATYIDAFDSMPLFFTTSAANYPVIFVDGVSGVTFNDLTVDGLGRGNSNPKFIGVAYFNAGGALNDLHVTNVMNTPFSGAQHGVGVYYYANVLGTYDFDMTDVLVDGFQKTAIAINGEGVTSDLLRVTTTGAGPTPITAQNGIQAGYGAVVNATDCNVWGIDYTGPDWSASGVLSVAGGIGNFDGCTIDACQTSAYFSDGGGSFDNSDVINPTGDALYAFSGGAKAAGVGKPAAQPFDGDLVAPNNKAAITVTIDGSTFTGTGATDSWGPTAYGYGPVTFTIDNSIVTNWDWGVVFYDFGGFVVDGSGANNDLDGNISYGAFSNAADLVDLRNNDWGDISGPYHPSKNPSGAGMTISDGIIATPWIGRITTLVADLGVTPTSPLLSEVGYGYWEGTLPLGLDDDFAPGFDPGAFQANVTAADPAKYTKYGWAPQGVFGRDVFVGELYKVTYHTKKGTSHVVDAPDWFAQFYTNGTAHGWYGERINAEPYFSESLTEVPGEWTEWQTDAGQPNRLRFFDSNLSLGSYTDGFLQDLTNDPFYADQTIMLFGLGTGTAWAEGFDGLVDGMTIELVSGEMFTMNFISGNTFVDAVPVATGPIPCGTPVTLTFNLTTDAYTPDVFGYNAVVRAPAGVDFGTIASLDPFGGTTTFLKYDNLDESWTISGTTTGMPSQPITTAGTHGLFTIVFTPTVEGDFDITYDLLQARDPNNAPIPVLGTGATISVDCTAPAAVTGIIADPAHNKINVSWTHDGTDVATYEVYRGLWYDTTYGNSAYPEYDDEAGDVIPTRPVDLADAIASDEWEFVDSIAVGTNILADIWTDHSNRGVYYYEVFPMDAATNAGPVAAANDRATNYWLGDVTGSAGPGNTDPDGLVDTGDMTALGASFGLPVPHGDPINVLDVGPTDDWGRLGIPTTDSVINFEDLMVFAMNFGVVSAAKADATIGTSVDLVWVSYDDGTMGLRLEGGQGLKGVRVVANSAVYDVRAGDLLDTQSELTFLENVGAKLDVSVAVMGVNTTFEGTGDLFVLSSEAAIDMKDLTITARALDNSEMEIRLESGSDAATPRVFALNGNYPNPFNPMTKISFSLPATHDVRLSVYAIDGRLVRTLVNETRGAGLHEVVWNGRDDSGRGVSSGTYFYRVEAGPYSDVKKMTLMK